RKSRAGPGSMQVRREFDFRISRPKEMAAQRDDMGAARRRRRAGPSHGGRKNETNPQRRNKKRGRTATHRPRTRHPSLDHGRYPGESSATSRQRQSVERNRRPRTGSRDRGRKSDNPNRLVRRYEGPERRPHSRSGGSTQAQTHRQLGYAQATRARKHP